MLQMRDWTNSNDMPEDPDGENPQMSTPFGMPLLRKMNEGSSPDGWRGCARQPTTALVAGRQEEGSSALSMG